MVCDFSKNNFTKLIFLKYFLGPNLLIHFNGTLHHRHITTGIPFHEPIFWSDDDTFFSDNNCYTLTKSPASLSLDVYFHFDPVVNDTKDGRKLFIFGANHESKKFCLDDYIYLNRMKEIQFEFRLSGKN